MLVKHNLNALDAQRNLKASGMSLSHLPMEQPRESDFVINLQTVQALGLTIPQHVLLQATEVIQ